MGGYVAFPGGVMAKADWVSPWLIHEQNSVAGLTNTTLLSHVSRSMYWWLFQQAFPQQGRYWLVILLRDDIDASTDEPEMCDTPSKTGRLKLY